ncbi:hypothetical protein Pyn_37507 [Prunus yedoensis var. nudiflora]|uniref:Uncharacterized protein n=1 Tax=Prunus yedoensis var. nudiflora TaxID=2094558 RepID=A0A314UWS2_PRUYE|nr:hypothetical protein Pyn_37507 [Prunus yedoensis var. nudiflora]
MFQHLQQGADHQPPFDVRSTTSSIHRTLVMSGPRSSFLQISFSASRRRKSVIYTVKFQKDYGRSKGYNIPSQ